MEQRDRAGFWAKREGSGCESPNKPLGPRRAEQGQPSRAALPAPAQGQGAEGTVTMHRAQADDYMLEEGGRDMILFTQLVKQLFPTSLVLRIMRHCALSAIKGPLSLLHHVSVQPGVRNHLGKSQQQLLR